MQLDVLTAQHLPGKEAPWHQHVGCHWAMLKTGQFWAEGSVEQGQLACSGALDTKHRSVVWRLQLANKVKSG